MPNKIGYRIQGRIRKKTGQNHAPREETPSPKASIY